MFEEGKTYTYDEIEKILVEGSAKTLKEIDDTLKEQKDTTGKMMFQMQNMMILSQFIKVLLKGESNGNN